MDYASLASVHLATVLPAFALGTFLLLNAKGTPRHRLLGKVYMALMVVTGLATLLMPAHVGPRWLGHFGFIHILSALTLYNVPQAYLAARRHDVARHRWNMVSLYVGGLLIAGTLALTPGRMLHTWLFA